MPSQPSDLTVPAIEISPMTISETEMQKPVVAKLLYKENAELTAEKQTLVLDLEAECSRREQLAAQLSQVDARRQVLEERLSTLGNRDSISQLIWGAIAIALSLAIDSAKSGNVAGALLPVALILFLLIAVYLLNRGRNPG
jgi:hypothetical protein